MPTYDLECEACGDIYEGVCSIDERNDQRCPECLGPLKCLMSPTFVRKSDATWIKELNGVLNDEERAMSGKEPKIETREDYARAIEKMYSDPSWEVQQKKLEYLERAGVKGCLDPRTEKPGATTFRDACVKSATKNLKRIRGKS